MPRLQPLIVPWQISPSVPCLALSTSWLDGFNRACVTFLGALGEATKLVAEYGCYQQIAVTLERVLDARLYPEFFPEDKARLDNYDWALALQFKDQENGYKNGYRVFHDRWNATDNCPGPRAYIVDNSDVMRRLGIKDAAFRHYLFVGDDYNVEVIAQSVAWRIVARSVDSENAS